MDNPKRMDVVLKQSDFDEAELLIQWASHDCLCALIDGREPMPGAVEIIKTTLDELKERL